jgi:hypothetical protein
MINIRWRVWLVLTMLVVAMPAAAQAVDCSGQPKDTPCDDTDGDVCTVAGCDGSGMCVQTQLMATPGTPCPDLDNNVCTIPSCNLVGECSQTRARAQAGTVCPDTDGRANTQARCDGEGNCDQSFIFDGRTAAPTLSAVGAGCLTTMLAALGVWHIRRRSLR